MNNIGNSEYLISLILFVIYGFFGALFEHLVFSFITIFVSILKSFYGIFNTNIASKDVFKLVLKYKINLNKQKPFIYSFSFFFVFTIGLSIIFYVTLNGEPRVLHYIFSFITFFVFSRLLYKYPILTNFIFRVISFFASILLFLIKIILRLVYKIINPAKSLISFVKRSRKSE